jgi:hypothetical protein
MALKPKAVRKSITIHKSITAERVLAAVELNSRASTILASAQHAEKTPRAVNRMPATTSANAAASARCSEPRSY